MSYLKDIIVEASVVGIGLIVIGTIVSYLIAKFNNRNTKFLKNPGMFVALFLTGFVLHILCDITGVNKWYCKNCTGCK